MSTTARKARKRAGIPFVRIPKVGTPIGDRAEFNKTVPGAVGTRHSLEYAPVSIKKRNRMLSDRGIDPTAFWKKRKAEQAARGHRKTKTPQRAA